MTSNQYADQHLRGFGKSKYSLICPFFFLSGACQLNEHAIDAYLHEMFSKAIYYKPEFKNRVHDLLIKVQKNNG